jgi:transposase
MAQMGRPKAELTLSDEERAALEAQLGSTPHAVDRWRARFVQYRIAGLGDMPRSGDPSTVTDEQVAAVVTETLGSTPKNATHWSTRSMAKETGLSQSSASRIWRAFGLQPHRSETFKLSTDPYFVDKVDDVVPTSGSTCDQQTDTARRSPVRPSPGEGHPQLDRRMEHRPEALRLDEGRRRDPRTPRQLSEQDS